MNFKNFDKKFICIEKLNELYSYIVSRFDNNMESDYCKTIIKDVVKKLEEIEVSFDDV